MEFFEQFGTNLSKKGKDVAKIAKDMSEVFKLNSKISSCEETIKTTYEQIGKKYYDSHKTEPAEEYQALFTKIADTYASIAHYRDEIQSIKGVDICGSCGAKMPVNSSFCPSCGIKREENASSPSEATTEDITKEMDTLKEEIFEE
ncbi:hypothetical protein acsn021_43470 [Anaerocolumna cellulosilytica]|uniref:Apea-like HEPN domain-containing protein n=1 Tax=Anaerocolumna cellulosilytica TaxID=433286 RepID=A0A6S6RD99_9FIRM|nr:zinc ribbon domain-containing protein [Anaerocolumna cellulosilytica]MBB5195305.1 DNA repair exonuclease SbcCD ATPase subunit [Anaerocolumna cellulosilytica]BCJ96778.1 hypothetical protein acsn021_43470 [Anaerocolumna cellulosilytica]